MKIVISIPIHEKIEVVIDQIANICRYINNPIIVLYVVKQLYEELNGDLHMLEEQGEGIVYVNPEHEEIRWGNISHPHRSNYQYISKILNGQFDYIVFHASNDMYVLEGVENYIGRYDAGFQRRILRYNKTMWWPCECAQRDKTLRQIMDNYGISIIVGSQIEGTFYKRQVFDKIMGYLEKVDLNEGEHYPKEEIYFSTIAYSMLNEERIGYPITYSEVHQFDKWLWRTYRLIHTMTKWLFMENKDIELAMCKLFEKNYQKYKPYAITIHTVKKIRKRDRRFYKRRNKMKDYPGEYELYDNNCFSVKRVARDLDDKVRVYIRNIGNY